MLGNFRDELGKVYATIGNDFPDLVVITADVSKSTRSICFKENWPDRFFSVGIAEANAVGIASGLASCGHPVIFTAYSVFATEKPFEQIRNSLCYPNMNVTIVATHGGISVGEDGATHQAIEDIAIMRALPNMKVIVAADPGEVKAAIYEAVRTPGPVYVRLGRSVGETLHPSPDEVSLSLGKAEILRDGKDVTLIGTGIMVTRCLAAAEALSLDGVDVGVINLRSIKPIDREAIISAAKRTGAIVTAEDHNRYGGIFGAVSEVLALECPVPVEYVAIEDTFGESGKGDLLLDKYGLNVNAIREKAIKVIARKESL